METTGEPGLQEELRVKQEGAICHSLGSAQSLKSLPITTLPPRPSTSSTSTAEQRTGGWVLAKGAALSIPSHRPIRLLAAMRVWFETTNTAACGNTGLLATMRSDRAGRQSRTRRALPIRPLAVIRAWASWTSPSHLTSPPTSPCPRGFLVLPG